MLWKRKILLVADVLEQSLHCLPLGVDEGLLHPHPLHHLLPDPGPDRLQALLPCNQGVNMNYIVNDVPCNIAEYCTV